MEYTEAVEIIAEFFRIGQWVANECGERYAIIDNDIEIRMAQESNGNIILHGMFGDPIKDQTLMNANETKLKYLLQVNFIRIIHHNDVLGIDGTTDRLSVTKHIAIRDMTMESLLNEVELFVQNVDFWDMLSKKKQTFSSMSPLLNFMRKR